MAQLVEVECRLSTARRAKSRTPARVATSVPMRSRPRARALRPPQALRVKWETADVQQPGGRIQLQLIGADMTGSLTLADGREVPVTGRTVEGDAGLYRAEAAGADGRAVAGWMLAADGQQRGGVGGFGKGTEVSGVRVLNLAEPTFSVQGVATARIAKVGITPIPIP